MLSAPKQIVNKNASKYEQKLKQKMKKVNEEKKTKPTIANEKQVAETFCNFLFRFSI